MTAAATPFDWLAEPSAPVRRARACAAFLAGSFAFGPVPVIPDGWTGQQPTTAQRARTNPDAGWWSGVLQDLAPPAAWAGVSSQPQIRSVRLAGQVVTPVTWEITPDQWQVAAPTQFRRCSPGLSGGAPGPVFVPPPAPYDPAALDWVGRYPTILRYRISFQAPSDFISTQLDPNVVTARFCYTATLIGVRTSEADLTAVPASTVTLESC